MCFTDVALLLGLNTRYLWSWEEGLHATEEQEVISREKEQGTFAEDIAVVKEQWHVRIGKEL